MSGLPRNYMFSPFVLRSKAPVTNQKPKLYYGLQETNESPDATTLYKPMRPHYTNPPSATILSSQSHINMTDSLLLLKTRPNHSTIIVPMVSFIVPTK